MKDFAALYTRLDHTTSLNEKIDALVAYFKIASPKDAAWTVALFAGQRPKKPVNRAVLRQALLAYLDVEEWMLEESHQMVGDLGETFALMIDTLRSSRPVESIELPLHIWMEEKLPELGRSSDESRIATLSTWWSQLATHEIFVLQKLIGGGLRVGVSKSLLIRALAIYSELSIPIVTQRLTGNWRPSEGFFLNLTAPSDTKIEKDPAQPFPFALAYPLDRPPEELGPVSDWAAEWKWDGIRAQLVRRADGCFIWSRGEELISDSFPDIVEPAKKIIPNGTVLDGELLVFLDNAPMPFAALQKRLGRKKPGATSLTKYPVQFIAYDILEKDAVDLRQKPFRERRSVLGSLFPTPCPPFRISPILEPENWNDLLDARTLARGQKVEGLMLKGRDSIYRAGRKKGDWWKWKIDPLTIDAVLLYAQAGSGRRANLFTDYTFGVWNEEGILIPVAKAYSGLNKEEISELDRWIRGHTKEKFGPVRSVELAHVFEIGFEGIQESARHKAGVALRFPRILRWRRDKPATEADRLDTVKALLDAPN